MPTVTYPLDMSGNNPANLIEGELHTVSESHFKDYFFIVPEFAPFYVDNFSLSISINGNITPLQEDVDYSFALQYVTGTRISGKAMYGAITLHNLNLNGILLMNYQTIGGDQIADRLLVLTTLADKAYNPRTTIWDILTNVPNSLPPSPHYQDYDQFLGQEELVTKLGEIRDAIITNSSLTQQEIQSFFQLLNSGTLTSYVSKSGDTMNGPLTLAGNPLDPLHAATKQYVDGLLENNSQMTQLLSSYAQTSYVNQQLNLKVNKGGDTMIGPLTLNQAPVQPSHAATKQYVDSVNQNTQLQIDQLQTQITNISLDPVTKAYVDDKFNEIMAILSSHLHGPRGI